MARRQTLEEARIKVKEKFPYLDLLSYTSAHSIAEFEDSEYGKFYGTYSKVLYGERRHPKRSAANKVLGSRKQSTKDKRANTCIERFGASTPLLNKDIQDKIKNTNLKRFGVDHPSKAECVIAKINNTKIARGISYDLNGLSARNIFDGYEPNFSYSKFLELIKSVGVDSALKWNKSKTDIEFVIENILNDLGVNFVYDKQLPGTSYRPDFRLGNLIIESDGLKHHSDLYIKDRSYHLNKQASYYLYGYTSLFFRGDEILQKTNIVKSIIRAKLNIINSKLFARKCAVNVLPDDCGWFANNHLMSKGTGKIYSLVFDGDIVACMQIIHKKEFVEISRFANKIDTLVVGGFSKLLKRVACDYNPKKIISFVDCRYGTGSSLVNIGFVEASNHVSFKWTDFKNTFHRMKYPGNSGYDNGLVKIWDCGQKKFVLNLR
ncbi:DUF559 domain-containing protein [Candidatus Pacearchaeota archaeon]|jgi:very-short-patch-repair endonuclease|nr:DUF559 domain-containing protein [Candidatus Pacearchaeota archaeon]